MKKLTAIGFMAVFMLGAGSAMAADCGCPPPPPAPCAKPCDNCPCIVKRCPTERICTPCGSVCCPKIRGILETRDCCAGCGL
jgi:hypothetical protein